MSTQQTISDFLPIKGAKLYYEITGQGFPLVLVHSRWMHSGLWDEQVKAFAPHYRVIGYDVRGFGKSDMELIPLSDVEDLRQLFDHLDIKQAYLVGLSMGAEIAMNFALAYPERVQALVASGAGLDEYKWDDSFWLEWNRFSDAIKTDNYALAIDQVVKMWVDGPIRPANDSIRARTREFMRGHTFLHHKPFPALSKSEAGSEPQPMAEPTPPLSEREKWGGLHVPTLMMVGAYDWPEMVAMSKILADYIRDAEQVVIPNAAHITNLEQPQAFNRTVLDFLTRH
jgi:pimeloyl-ACP methyl ester carboxylesterase